MKLETKYVGLIAIFSALITVSAIIAHAYPWIGHPTIGAILITFLYLTAFGITEKHGITTLIGLAVGIINSSVFGLPIHVLIHLTRGGTFDLFFMVTHHRLCCKKCAVVSGILSFYVTMIVMFALLKLVGMPLPWFMLFVIAGPLGALLSIPGSLLALKYKKTFRTMVGKAL